MCASANHIFALRYHLSKRENLGISKPYRLKSKKKIQALFSEGERVRQYPLHALFIDEPSASMEKLELIQVSFSAPKRIHGRAVDRIRHKRRMREAFRPFIPKLEALMEKKGHRLCLMLIYVGREEASVIDLSTKIKVLLARLEQHIIPPSTDE